MPRRGELPSSKLIQAEPSDDELEGPYTLEQLQVMNERFVAALESAIAAGLEQPVVGEDASVYAERATRRRRAAG